MILLRICDLTKFNFSVMYVELEILIWCAHTYSVRCIKLKKSKLNIEHLTDIAALRK